MYIIDNSLCSFLLNQQTKSERCAERVSTVLIIKVWLYKAEISCGEYKFVWSSIHLFQLTTYLIRKQQLLVNLKHVYIDLIESLLTWKWMVNWFLSYTHKQCSGIVFTNSCEVYEGNLIFTERNSAIWTIIIFQSYLDNVCFVHNMAWCIL